MSEERQSTNVSIIAPAHDPSAEFHLQYVQFADGTVWGDEFAAQDALSVRSAIFGRLLKLQGQGNNWEFLALLQEKIRPHEADRFLRVFDKSVRTKAPRLFV